MHILGAQFADSVASGGLAAAKMVFNANGAIIFPASEQHRDQKDAGISYEDDYQGNALAAVLSNQLIEVRFHKQFSDTQVKNLFQELARQPELTCIRDWRVTYQGRNLSS